MRIVAVLILIVTFNKGNSQNLELWVSDPNVIVGEKISFSLSISEVDTLEFLKNSKFKFDTENKFRYSFEIIPEYTGKYDVGPFSIMYGGKELTSNIIEMNVLDPDIKAIIIYLELPEKVKQDEETTITFVGALSSLSEINLKESENFHVVSSGLNTSFTFKDGKSIKVIKKSFIVKFIQKGDFIIDETWLESLREYSKIESKTIKVF
ncbi:MAG: hypothetical protein H6588_08525 [Flavobacteriales bacterium]|nr:hypothetical protein [Flavobacteriales bacterium]